MSWPVSKSFCFLTPGRGNDLKLLLGKEEIHNRHVLSAEALNSFEKRCTVLFKPSGGRENVNISLAFHVV